MNIKNKKITKKDWYLKTIKHILETYILIEESDEHIELNRYLEIKGKYEFIVEYIKSDLNEEISDYLTCIGDVGGKQDEQLGMLEVIDLFSYLDFKVEDFNIERKNPIGKICDYTFKIKNKYEYLSTFFSEFIVENAEKILDEVIKFD